MARTWKYGVFCMGARGDMGRATMDGDGTRDQHGGVFDEWAELAGMRCECV